MSSPVFACAFAEHGEKLEAVLKADSAFTFQLPDRRLIRLIGLEAPPGAGRSAIARDLVETMPEPAKITILSHPDRHGLLPALIAYHNHDLRIALLQLGLAYRLPHPLEPCKEALINAEQAAIRAGRGIWAENPPLQINGKDKRPVFRNEFAIIDGFVFSARSSKGMIYLNLGPRGSGALTLTLREKERAAFAAKGLDPANLEGRAIRARGIVERGRFLRMRLEGPDFLELVP